MQAALAAITLAASIVNGAIGYGFSSITVPLALLFLSNRVLNPALVPIEIGVNAYVLWMNRAAARTVVRRVLPIVGGLAPGVAAGTLIVSSVDAGWVKLATFAVLLPLILLQAAGFRRRLRAERTAGVALGGGVGMLYAVTTVSGPPLALMLNNQGLANAEFRAGMAVIRLAEGTMTAAAYAVAGLYTRESLLLIPVIVPGVLLGVPIGAWLIRRVDAEAFGRVCMSFDALLVAIGIAVLLPALDVTGPAAGFALVGLVIAMNIALLYGFFSSPRPAAQPPDVTR
ncbi:MAG: sulfite exporter TauE/SafE family protein [Vicinamibacterales bacterium]